MKQKRIPFFYVLRALCAIQVIIIWHGLSYYYEGSIFLSILAPFTGGALACFTCISGMFNNTSGKKVISFYNSRIKRFYLPYILAYVSLLLIGYNSFLIKNTLFSILGLSCFLGGQPKTLWYISMLIVFYIITPILCSETKEGIRDVHGTVVRCSLFFLIFMVVYFFLPNFEIGLIQYFPFYAIGLCISPTTLIASLENRRKTEIGILVLFLILYVIIVGVCLSNIKNAIICSIGFCFYIVLASVLSKCNLLVKWFSLCSEASMFAYLYHRLFFYICIVIFGRYGNLLTTICMLLLVFPTSYYLQKKYNLLVAKYEKIVSIEH